MKPVIQQELTGCGIASAAAIAGVSYSKARQLANCLGIYADDSTLWSETQHVRKLLRHLGVNTRKLEKPFKSWCSLPDCALLSIKWHKDKGKPYWHHRRRHRHHRLRYRHSTLDHGTGNMTVFLKWNRLLSPLRDKQYINYRTYHFYLARAESLFRYPYDWMGGDEHR